MDLVELQKEHLKILQEKGWGTTLEEMNIPEKYMLIQTEISEAYDGFIKNNFTGRHGFNEEISDALLRTLHLMAAFNLIPKVSPGAVLPATIHEQIAYLHKVVSESYEEYRHNNLEKSKQCLQDFLSGLFKLSEKYNFSLFEEAEKKLVINRERIWPKNGMNEQRAD